MDVRKQKLIEALKEEQSRFKQIGHDIVDHDIAIEYLETGKTDEDPDYYELLDAVMNDYDTICSDYGV
jgi:hypothetical protein